jgi:hypothetical protein
MHANEDIWEIKQIVAGKGTRMMKEAMKRIVVTSVGPATTAVMVVATMGSQAMRTGRAATTGLVAMMELVTTRMRISWLVRNLRMAWSTWMSDIWVGGWG